jgi:hypothetical protein
VVLNIYRFFWRLRRDAEPRRALALRQRAATTQRHSSVAHAGSSARPRRWYNVVIYLEAANLHANSTSRAPCQPEPSSCAPTYRAPAPGNPHGVSRARARSPPARLAPPPLRGSRAAAREGGPWCPHPLGGARQGSGTCDRRVTGLRFLLTAALLRTACHQTVDSTRTVRATLW